MRKEANRERLLHRKSSVTLNQATQNSTSRLNIGEENRAQAERHLIELCGTPIVKNVRFLFCSFSDTAETGRPWQRYGTLNEVWREIQHLQSMGYGVFVCVNWSRNGRRKKADINRVRAVWGDFDQQMVGKFSLEPSIEISTSPGRGQTYWLIDQTDPLPPHECEQLNRTIAEAHGADLRACDRSRVLRLAGTYHLKGEPYLVQIVKVTGQRFGRQQLFEAYPPPKIEPVPQI